MTKFRWGILGTGNIARKFAEGLTALPDAELVAVGSRAQHTADAFADEWGAEHRHGSYAALAADPDVDAVYVATPHTAHQDNTILCLEAGKAVLCEKPMAVNARQAGEMVDCARREGRFLMEAMWTRFLPAMVRVRELLAEGAIGQVLRVEADFCFRAGWNPEGRLFDPALAGGGLLDVGVYCIALASMVFGGPPEREASLALLGESGVDEQAGMVFAYAGGGMAVLSCGIRISIPQAARITGTEGRIEIPDPFWSGSSVRLVRQGSEPELMELPYEGNGYNCEAAAVAECVRAGRTECDAMPLDETLQIAATMDRCRAAWGLRYPME